MEGHQHLVCSLHVPQPQVPACVENCAWPVPGRSHRHQMVIPLGLEGVRACTECALYDAVGYRGMLSCHTEA